MNPNYSEFKFPQIKAVQMKNLFRKSTDPQAIDLIKKILVYDPKNRLKPFEAMVHSYFEDLRKPETTLPNGSPCPDLFNFKEEELLSADAGMREQLIPDWYVPKTDGGPQKDKARKK